MEFELSRSLFKALVHSSCESNLSLWSTFLDIWSYPVTLTGKSPVSCTENLHLKSLTFTYKRKFSRVCSDILVSSHLLNCNDLCECRIGHNYFRASLFFEVLVERKSNSTVSSSKIVQPSRLRFCSYNLTIDRILEGVRDLAGSRSCRNSNFLIHYSKLSSFVFLLTGDSHECGQSRKQTCKMFGSHVF